MKLERIGEQLDAFRDEVSRKWSKLTKSDLAELDHDLGSLSGVLSKRYSMPAKQAREEAESFVNGFGTSFKEAAELVGDAARDLSRVAFSRQQRTTAAELLASIEAGLAARDRARAAATDGPSVR